MGEDLGGKLYLVGEEEDTFLGEVRDVKINYSLNSPRLKLVINELDLLSLYVLLPFIQNLGIEIEVNYESN